MTFTCTCLADDVEAVLGLVAGVVTRPTFPAEQVERRRTGGHHLNSAGRGQPGGGRDRRADGLAVSWRPSIRAPQPRAPSPPSRQSGSDALKCLSPGARRRRRRCASSSSATSRPARALALAETAFGGWEAPPGAPLSPPRAGARPSRTLREIALAGKVQSDIAYGFISVVRTDPRYYALTLMNTVLGQYAMGGRLGRQHPRAAGHGVLRVQRLRRQRRRGPARGSRRREPLQTSHGHIASIDEEVGRMARDGVTRGRACDAKRYLIGSMPRMLETNGGIASFLHTADFFDLGLDFDQRLPALLERRDTRRRARRRADVPGARSSDDRRRRSSCRGGLRASGVRCVTTAVCFDVDFTLIYPGPTFRGEGYREFGDRHGLTPRRSELRSRRRAGGADSRRRAGRHLRPGDLPSLHRVDHPRDGRRRSRRRAVRDRDLRGVGDEPPLRDVRGRAGRAQRRLPAAACASGSSRTAIAASPRFRATSSSRA